MTDYRQLFQIEGDQITKLSKSINKDQLSQLINILGNNQQNILITGCGTSATVAKKAVHTLSVIGESAFYLNPSDAVHGSLGVIKQNDIVIFISKGGSTKELTSFVKNVKEKKAKVILVTENEKSVLTKYADLIVKVKVEKELDSFNMLATTSSLAVISLFDVVAIALMKGETFTEKDFLVNHPSGDVGQRLATDVKK